MKHWLVWALVIFLSFIESSVWSIPLVLTFLLAIVVFKKEPWVFLLAFVGGVILDMFALSNIGFRSLYFIFFLFTILLYERKFEIQTTQFVSFSSFIGSVLYAFLLHYSNILLYGFFGSISAVVFFLVFTKIKQ